MNKNNNTAGIQPDTTSTSHNNNTLNNQLQQNQQIIAKVGAGDVANVQEHIHIATATKTSLLALGCEKKKDPTKPKKPLSSYNLFMRLEKERLIQMKDGELSEEYKEGKELLSGMPSRYQHILLSPNWDKHTDGSKRKHRKANHGKDGMVFTDLSKLISDGWKEVKTNDHEALKFLEEKSEKSMVQYDVAMKKWEEEKKVEEEVTETHVPNKRSAEKTSPNAGNPIKKVRIAGRNGHDAVASLSPDSLQQPHSPVNTAKYLSSEYELEKQEWDKRDIKDLDADILRLGKNVMSTAVELLDRKKAIENSANESTKATVVTSPTQPPPTSNVVDLSIMDDETAWGGDDTGDLFDFDMNEPQTMLDPQSTGHAASDSAVFENADDPHASNNTSVQHNLLSHTLSLKTNGSTTQGKENEKNGTDSVDSSKTDGATELLLSKDMTKLIEQASIDMSETQKNACAKGKQEVDVVMAEAKKKIVSITVKTAANNINGIVHVYENAVEKFEKQNTDQSLLDKQQAVEAELGPLLVKSILGDNSNEEKIEVLKAEALTIKTEIERSQKMVDPFKKQLRKVMVERHTATKHLYYKQGKYPLPHDVIAKQEARLSDGLGCELSTIQSSE